MIPRRGLLSALQISSQSLSLFRSLSHAKPNPEIYLKACEAIGTEPVHSIALEDAPAGIRSASAAGMIPVMIPDLAQPDEEVRGLCRYVYPTLLDVIKMLDRENAEAGR